MIEVRTLSKSYRSLKVLDGISLAITPGKITGLIGPNGCGKTTLIKTILGLVSPDHGEILVNGENSRSGISYRRKIGYMPQSPDFPSNLRVRELFDMIEDIRGEKGTLRRELSSMLQIEKINDQAFGTLSGGSKQRVAAVMALMFNSPILILDEPTVGLDPVSSNRLKSLISAKAEAGAAVLLVSHIMSEVEQICTAMVFLLEGKVLFQGPLEELKRKAGHGESLEAAVAAFLEGRHA